MADARLRTLARAAAQEQCTLTRVRALRERLRAGLLTEESLALAAHLGDEAAETLAAELGVDPREGSCTLLTRTLRGRRFVPRQLAWAEQISSWGLVAHVRALISVGELALEVLRVESQLAREALNAARAWCVCPCAAHAESAAEAASRLRREQDARIRSADPPAYPAYMAADAPRLQPERELGGGVISIAVMELARRLPSTVIEDRLRTDVIGWALFEAGAVVERRRLS